MHNNDALWIWTDDVLRDNDVTCFAPFRGSNSSNGAYYVRFGSELWKGHCVRVCVRDAGLHSLIVSHFHFRLIVCVRLPSTQRSKTTFSSVSSAVWPS